MMRAELDEREQLRAFILRVADFLLGRLPGPNASLHASLRESVKKCRSLRGLREAARDTVEWCQDLSSEQVAELDDELSGAGLPSLSAMRDRRYRSLIGILTRGHVSSEADYRLLTSYLADVDDAVLSREERDRAEGMLTKFQRRAG